MSKRTSGLPQRILTPSPTAGFGQLCCFDIGIGKRRKSQAEIALRVMIKVGRLPWLWAVVFVQLHAKRTVPVPKLAIEEPHSTNRTFVRDSQMPRAVTRSYLDQATISR